ncbi:hypothetical protein Tco_0591298 [Tanacetum coccineum]
MRANRADTVYMSFGAMIKDFTREDLIELYRLVMQKYGTNRPEDAYDRVLWSDLRTMFDSPLNEDSIWSLPLQQKMVSWRYYDKRVVHCLTLEASTIYMLADRKYPLSKDACQVMLKMKLLDGTMDEVCYKLLKMIEKQAGIRNCEEKTKTKRQKLSKGANPLQTEGLDLFSKSIQQKRIQDFTPIDSEKEAQKSGKRLKRVAGSYATQKSPKKPKVMKFAKDVTEEEAAEYKKEKEELRLSLNIISNDDNEGDLRMIFDPDEKDELWMNQLDWKLLRWKLYESCRVYTLFMDGKPMEINMLVDKKYPLVKELLEKMLNL